MTNTTPQTVLRQLATILKQGDWTALEAHPGMVETRQHFPAMLAAFPEFACKELAAGERRYLLQGYAMNQRVGMTMHQPPLRSFTAKDQGHAQRPVLIRQTADLAMLPFDHHQNDDVARCV